MPSPFPGVDPFIEAQDRWHSFHTAYIAVCAELLNEHLPSDYYATVEERVLLEEADPRFADEAGALHRFGPDASIQHSAFSKVQSAAEQGAVATAEPRVILQDVVSFDQPTQKFIEIRGMPARDLVTTVELLSPTNKGTGSDRTAYLAKRNDMLRHGVNTVDLDFLLAGQRLPLLAPIPAGDFHAFVTQAASATQCEVYSWTVREASPTIRIPLKEKRKVALDLQAAFVRVWDRHRYSMQITYEQPIPSQLAKPDREWVAQLLPK